MIYFSILIIAVVLYFSLIVSVVILDEIATGAGVALFGMIPIVVIAGPWLISYTGHSEDIATIQEQHRVITVYHNRIDSLSERLNKIANNGVSSDALVTMNKDTPIGSIVGSITQFETKIADAEEKKAEAYRSIAQRKIGLTNSVTWFFDGLDEEE